MSNLTEDEELQLAIRMSLESYQANASENASVLEDDRNESNQNVMTQNSRKRKAGVESQPLAEYQSNSSQPISNGILGFDRKQMEQDRLARRAKVSQPTRAISPPATRRSNGSSSAALVPGEPAEKKRRIGVSGNPIDLTAAEHQSKPSSFPKEDLPQASKTHLRFSKPMVKRTWAKGQPRRNDITFEEVVQKDELRKAMLSSYQWDHEWLFKKLDTTRTDLLMVVQAKTPAEQEQIQAEGRDVNSRIKLCFPPMPGQVNCMHSKLMLLFYDDYMRIAVPSANLTEYDWGDSGVMENTVFLVDLPLLSSNQQTAAEMPDFARSLHYFLVRKGVPDSLLKAIKRYDFEATKGIAFVHSVGGTHFDVDLHENGYLGLNRAVRRLGLETSAPVEVDFSASSLGSLNDDYLKLLYSAVQGQQPSEAQILKYSKQPPNVDLSQHFRIYFPTHDTVTSSLGGVNAGGTICLQSKWYSGPRFPRALMRDYRSTRKGLLSHNKILLVRGQQSTPSGGEKPIAWAYVGSANLSESAWGKVVQDRSRVNKLKLNCRNWECGVLVPVQVSEDTGGVPSPSIFQATLDVPFEIPGVEYQGRKPWFFMG